MQNIIKINNFCTHILKCHFIILIVGHSGSKTEEENHSKTEYHSDIYSQTTSKGYSLSNISETAELATGTYKELMKDEQSGVEASA